MSLLTKGEIRHVQSCCFAFCQAIAYLTFSSPPASQAPSKRTQHCWPTTPNTVGCYILCPFVHPVSCCWMLLRVVAQSLRPVKLVSQQLPTFFFCSVIAEAYCNNVGSVCAALPTLLGPRTLITHGLQRLMGCILPTMHCRSQTCWELLHPFAHHCQHARNNSQHCWRNNVGSCCARLHAALNFLLFTIHCDPSKTEYSRAKLNWSC